MEQTKGNLWIGMTIFANYAIVLILTVITIFSSSLLFLNFSGKTLPVAVALVAYGLAVPFSLWLGVHSVKKVTPISKDNYNYLKVSAIAVSPVVILQSLITIFLGTTPRLLVSSLIGDALIVGLSCFFASRPSIAFKDNAKLIVLIGAGIAIVVYLVSFPALTVSPKYSGVNSKDKELTEEEYQKALEALRVATEKQYAEIEKQNLEGATTGTAADQEAITPSKPSAPTPAATAPAQQQPATEIAISSHPNGNIFSTCENKPVTPVPTTIMERDDGLILVRQISASNPETTDKYEINICRGFIGWAPEGWFKNGKLEAYFRYSTGSQPLNVMISGENRWGGLAPFKIDFSSFLSPAMITQGTLIIIKADPNIAPARKEIHLNVETVI